MDFIEDLVFYYMDLYLSLLSGNAPVICNHGTIGWSRDIDFPPYKIWVYAQHCGDIFMVNALPKALLQSLQVNVK